MPRTTQLRANQVDWTAVARLLERTTDTFHSMGRDQILREIDRARNEPRYCTAMIDFLDRNLVDVPLRSLPVGYLDDDLVQDEVNNDPYCDYCGNIHWMDQEPDITDEDGRRFHSRCFTINQLNLLPMQPDHDHDHRSDDQATCLACNGLRSDAAHIDTGLGPIHRSCLRTRVERLVCSRCGSFGANFPIVQGIFLCPTCIETRPVQCTSCGVNARINEGMVRVHETDDRGYICPDCAQGMFRCKACRCLVKTKGKNTDGLCLPCFVRTKPSRRIHPYNFKPKPRFHGKEKVQYGLELEVDGFPSRDHARFGTGLLYQAEKGETSFYIKSDGSLNNGYELVFHPRDLMSWWNYEPKLTKLTESIQTSEGKSFNTSTCGVHVHRGNNDISGYHIIKMNYLLSKFRKLTRTIALRGPNHYSCEVGIIDENTEDRKVDCYRIKSLYNLTKRDAHYRRYNVDRYYQLNFQNENTIELRIFKGNLNVTTILSYVMFFDRLVEFTRKQTIRSMEQITENDMISLFNGFCKTMTTRSTLGKRKNNNFTKVSAKVTERISSRLDHALRNQS